jgi:hypothetical protein
MVDIEETTIELPIKEKKPRSEKQIQAFKKAIAKKAELALINKEFNEAKQTQKNEVIEHKKRIIKTVKEPEVEIEVEVEPEVEIKKPTKKKVVKKKVIESSSEESEQEEEVIVKRRKKKAVKPKPTRKIIYEDTSSESENDDEAIVNYAKIIKKTARERLKEELNAAKMNQAMASLGYI